MPGGWIDWDQSEMSLSYKRQEQGRQRREKDRAMLEEAFWRSIQEAPDDDAPRLIYADWLDEQGNPALSARAEFIRVQCELARLPLDEDDKRAQLERREAELWRKHRSVWIAPLKPFSRKFAFRRGFPDQVLVQGKTFLQHAEKVLSVAPVFSIRLRHAKEQIAELAKCPSLSRLISLSLYWNHIGLARAGVLFQSPHLENLSELDLNDNLIRPGGVEALVAARLPRLTALNLRGNELRDAGVEMLAGSPLLKQLHTLKLSHNDAGDSALRSLVLSENVANLTHLDLGGNPGLGDTFAEALAASTNLPRLTTLNLEGRGSSRGGGARGFTSAGVRSLAASPTVRNLTSLNLAGQSIQDAGVQALVESTYLTQLTTLSLRGCSITSGVAALATASFLPSLISLDLWYNRLDVSALKTFLDSRDLTRLRYLNLSHCYIGDEGATILAQAASLARLRELNLAGCQIGPRGAAALAESPCLAGLAALDLTGCPIEDEGALALARSPHLTRLRRLGVTIARWRVGGYSSEQGEQALIERFGRDVCAF
jgi:uncharacterized protein (TIGR02996 family)